MNAGTGLLYHHSEAYFSSARQGAWLRLGNTGAEVFWATIGKTPMGYAGAVTRLLQRHQEGDPLALDELYPLVYSQLREIPTP